MFKKRYAKRVLIIGGIAIIIRHCSWLSIVFLVVVYQLVLQQNCW